MCFILDGLVCDVPEIDTYIEDEKPGVIPNLWVDYILDFCVHQRTCPRNDYSCLDQYLNGNQRLDCIKMAVDIAHDGQPANLSVAQRLTHFNRQLVFVMLYAKPLLYYFNNSMRS